MFLKLPLLSFSGTDVLNNFFSLLPKLKVFVGWQLFLDDSIHNLPVKMLLCQLSGKEPEGTDGADIILEGKYLYNSIYLYNSCKRKLVRANHSKWYHPFNGQE